MVATASNLDTAQERKKARLAQLLKQLMNEVEERGAYGEFGVSFNTQNGQIGHFEVRQKDTYK